MTNSRAKGSRYEREVASAFREQGFPARRAQQYSGTGVGDVLVENTSLHVECKHRERLNVYDAMAQAVEDMPEGATPVVFHRRNGVDSHVTMRAEDWFVMLREAHEMYWRAG